MIQMVVGLAIITLMIISRWRIFSKAGLPGWGIFIPFYNRYLMFKLGGRSGRNFLWIFVPPVFVILIIINYFKISKVFGKHWTYGLGILFLKVIFIPILAFDNSKYIGKKLTAKVAARTTTKVIATPAKVQAPIKKAIKKPAAKAVVKSFVKIAKTKPTTKLPTKVITQRSSKTPTKKAPKK